MVQVSRFLKKNSSGEGGLPLLNSLFVEQFSVFGSFSSDNSFKQYMKWARKSPQFMGFLNIIATDILSDHIDFIPLEKGSSGRNKKLKARVFWEANDGIDLAEETIYDMLTLGIGFNWMGVINDVQLKEMCELVTRELYEGKETREYEMKAADMFRLIKKNKKEDLAKNLRHMAASTVTKHTDAHTTLNYIQRVGTNTRIFEPEEVIEFRLMPFDGKVNPYPPMEGLLAEIYLLWLITQNYVSFFENGGKPDNVFILPNEIANSKNHDYLINTLKKYKKIQNKHGNLVFTGDLKIEKLMEIEHQMENKDLGLYLVSVLAMFFGIPIGRIPFLVGKAAAAGDAGGLADSGYWRKISVWQSKIEAGYNKKLFHPFFGVSMKFGRGYLQDEVRETQTEMQKTSVAEQRLRLGVWTVEAAGDYLGIDEEEIKEAQEQKKKRDEEEMKSQMDQQNFEKKNDVINNPDKQKKDKKKKDTQKRNQKDAGGKKLNP